MQSVENSPIALALAQIVLFVVQAIIYSRQKSALDVEKRDRAVFGPQVTHALEVAQAAKRDVETIELSHYKKLAALFEAQSTELANAKAQIRALEETVTSLSNKLASRERADAKAAKRAAQADDAEEPEPSSAPNGAQVDLDELLRTHGHPMGGAGLAAPEPPPRTRPFGKPL